MLNLFLLLDEFFGMSKTIGFTVAVMGFSLMFFNGPVQLAGASLAVVGVSLAWYAERPKA